MDWQNPLSQSSVASTVSTIPPGIIDYTDDDFISEINQVNDLYFGNLSDSNLDARSTCDDNLSDSELEVGNGSDICDDDDVLSDSEKENEDSLINVPLDISAVDRFDHEKVEKFRLQTCSCSRLYGKPCSNVVEFSSVLKYRNHCREISSDELDLIIKVQLFHHRKNDASTTAKKHKSKEKERPRQEYFFQGRHVCRETFAFCHGICRKKVDAIARSLDNEGLVPRTHGNKGKSPKHSLTVNDLQLVKDFLIRYGNKYGLPLPGRLPNYKENRAVILPSDKSKADIHQDYLVAAVELNLRKICLSEFKKLWLDMCPYLLISKPSTDLCSKCQSYSFVLSHGGNMTEEEKTQHLDNYKQHVDKSKTQRDHYRRQCEESKLNFLALSDQQQTRGQPPCSLKGTQHYSFDYAQQVHYPHYAQQVGPLFFKTPRKCQCFGICSEGSGSQIFYLVDEAQYSGKGANSVASMLHHHFQHRGYGETDLQLHMDNCTGQNKNNTVLGYGMWRVLTGGHKTIEFSLMEAGHTKFHPDWHFGLWKMKWRTTTVETMTELVNSVSASSRNNHNIPQVVDDPHYPVVFYDWSSFLKQYFKPIHQLKQYHHFRMSHENPGIVFCRRYASDEEESIDIRKNKEICFQSLPKVIEPTGLDAQRQWYLYDEVAPYCNNTEACPRPEMDKPSNGPDNSVSKRKCGYCRETGHSKSCLGKRTCPKLMK